MLEQLILGIHSIYRRLTEFHWEKFPLMNLDSITFRISQRCANWKVGLLNENINAKTFYAVKNGENVFVKSLMMSSKCLWMHFTWSKFLIQYSLSRNDFVKLNGSIAYSFNRTTNIFFLLKSNIKQYCQQNLNSFI